MECRSKILFVKDIPAIGEQFEDLFRQQPGFVAIRRKPNFAFVEYKDKEYSCDVLHKLQGFKFDPIDKPIIIDYDRGSKDYQDEYYRGLRDFNRKREVDRVDRDHRDHRDFSQRDQRDPRDLQRDQRDYRDQHRDQHRDHQHRDQRYQREIESDRADHQHHHQHHHHRDTRDTRDTRREIDVRGRDHSDNVSLHSSKRGGGGVAEEEGSIIPSSKDSNDNISILSTQESSGSISTMMVDKKDMDDDDDFDDEDQEKSIKHRPRRSNDNGHERNGEANINNISDKPSSSSHYNPLEKKRQREDYHHYESHPRYSQHDDRGGFKRSSQPDPYDRPLSSHHYTSSGLYQRDHHYSPYFNSAQEHGRESRDFHAREGGIRSREHGRDSAVGGYGYPGSSSRGSDHLLVACPTLFVSNLPKDVTEREMSILFRFMGGFIGIRLINKEGKLPICFCDFIDTPSAAMALDMLQGFRMDPKDISSSISIEFDKANTKR
ncbi:hypothetical protein CYY_000051 [Polysphondylium violaceum]|uniref:RRM domain-containing protein n=1 Tax=Polysphondylium violaceum TaxID=133409 RepID=A0A8J4Q3L3_9MYCE|nr:hypothetical protein CYY_000051 [Polysphondylium violaceum]